jgi:hypothetical protein
MVERGEWRGDGCGVEFKGLFVPVKVGFFGGGQ